MKSFAKCPTFTDLCKKDPKLQNILDDVIQHTEFEESLFKDWSKLFKPRITERVGFSQKAGSLLSSCEAYDLVYHTIFDELEKNWNKYLESKGR